MTSSLFETNEQQIKEQRHVLDQGQGQDQVRIKGRDERVGIRPGAGLLAVSRAM